MTKIVSLRIEKEIEFYIDEAINAMFESLDEDVRRDTDNFYDSVGDLPDYMVKDLITEIMHQISKNLEDL